MIEFESAPADRIVAAVAFFTELALVRIVFGMAVETVLAGFAVFLLFQVTAAAFREPVPAGQLVVGESMIEFIPVQPDDLCIAPLVLAMAGLAFQPARIFILSVKALLITNVVCHRLMVVAIKA